jgi:hypothetical protein
MRLAFAFLPLVATLMATPASAIGLLLPAVQAVIAGVESPVTDLEVTQGGRFRGGLSFLACDGSVLPAGAQLCDGSVLPNDMSLTVLGSVFPFVDLTVSVVDNGLPTLFVASVFVPLGAPIAGLGDWSLEGTLTVPGRPRVQGTVSPGGTPSGRFIEGLLNGGVPLASLGALPVAQDVGLVVAAFGPSAGTTDCGAIIGGCTGMTLVVGFTGLGDGQSTTINARFNLDPATPIPLPAALPLLAAGLGLLGVIGRRSKAAA